MDIVVAIEAQAEQVMKNLVAVLKPRGRYQQGIGRPPASLSDMNNFGGLQPGVCPLLRRSAPARSCVEVARLPKDVLVEVEALAYV